MKFAIFVIMSCVVAGLTVALPVAEEDVVAIITNNVVHPSASGEYSFDTETANGIVVSESGSGTGPKGAVETQGSVSFTHPDGTPFELSYVANAAGGYQPESPSLPVAPAFPHEIPQFVLDQIAFAATEDDNRGSDESQSYQ